MDVILSRAGLSPAQQRTVCYGAMKDEVKNTEAKLADTLASLKQLREVVRVARDVHNAQPSVMAFPTSVKTTVARMTQVSETIGPLLEDIRSSLKAFARPGSFEYSTEEEDAEGEELVAPSSWRRNRDVSRQRSAFAASSGPARQSATFFMAPSRWNDPSTFERDGQQNRYPRYTRRPDNFSDDSASDTPMRSPGHAMPSMRSGPSNSVIGQKRRASSPPHPVGNSFLRPTTAGQLLFPRPIERESIWPRYGEYWMLNDRQRPRSPVPQSEKKIAQIIDGLKLRLSKLPDTEQESAFPASIKAAIEVVGLEQVEDEVLRVEKAVKSARAAVKCLLDRHSRSPESDEQQHRLEDVRQVLFAVVRAILDTKGKLDGSELRDLHDITRRIGESFPGSAARFKWCNTQLRKFLTAKYKKPAQISVDDQNKLVSIVAETRNWQDLNDYTAVRFKEVMAFVTEILDGSYEDWEPQGDSRVAELVGIMIVRVGAFRDSHVQKSRQIEIHRWVYDMLESSFLPTLDLVSAPPQKPAMVYATANPGFCSMAEVDEGFDQMAKAQALKWFEFLALTAYTFLATATLTQNQVLLPIDQLKRFNEGLQGLKDLDISRDPKAVLQSYQVLEKILYLMRVMMRLRPEYQECSTSTVDTLLSLFPSSKRPTFEYLAAVNSTHERSYESGED